MDEKKDEILAVLTVAQTDDYSDGLTVALKDATRVLRMDVMLVVNWV